MARFPNAPQFVFDTSIPSVRGPRAFWGTLCGLVGQPLRLTETSAKETLRRERIETEREWRDILRKMRHEMGWNAKEVRRLSTAAAQASQERIGAALQDSSSPYEVARRTRTAEEDELEMRIEDLLEKNIFDMSTDNGIRDRKIAIEAMLGGHDILATNNVGSIDHEWLQYWIDSGPGATLGITTAVLSPTRAEGRVRRACQQPPEWVAEIAARACVTQPEDRAQSSREIHLLMEHFDERGMGVIRERIERVLSAESALDAMLDAVSRHGVSAGTFRQRMR